MRTRPDDYPGIFGRNFATRNNGTIVQIGKKSYTRYDLGAIGCPHINSAHTVDRALRKLKIDSVEDLVQNYSPEDFVGIDRLGVTAFYVLTCILRDSKVNLGHFYKSKVTVNTMAHNEKRKRAEEEHQPKPRKRGTAA